MSTTKLTGRENLTKYAFWLGPGGQNIASPVYNDDIPLLNSQYLIPDITPNETYRYPWHS